jgi:hypothetical protein
MSRKFTRQQLITAAQKVAEKRPGRIITGTDVAREAGASVSTVRRVLGSNEQMQATFGGTALSNAVYRDSVRTVSFQRWFSLNKPVCTGADDWLGDEDARQAA